MDHATPEEKTEAHNKGQEDAANYEYNRPHDVLESNVSAAAGAFTEENEAYNEGWAHGKSQR
jgi:hypothetical protein